jgi:hypothetical protein
MCACQTGLRVAKWNAGHPGRANIYWRAVNCESNIKDSGETFSHDTVILCLCDCVCPFCCSIPSLYLYIPAYLLHTCLSVCLFIYVCLSIQPYICLFIHPALLLAWSIPIYSNLFQSIQYNLCIYLLSIHPSIRLSTYLSLYTSFYFCPLVIYFNHIFALLCYTFLLPSVLSVSFPLSLILLHFFKLCTLSFYDFFPLFMPFSSFPFPTFPVHSLIFCPVQKIHKTFQSTSAVWLFSRTVISSPTRRENDFVLLGVTIISIITIITIINRPAIALVKRFIIIIIIY